MNFKTFSKLFIRMHINNHKHIFMIMLFAFSTIYSNAQNQLGVTSCMGVNTVNIHMAGQGTLETAASTADKAGARYRYSNANVGGTVAIDLIAELIALNYGSVYSTAAYTFQHDVPGSTIGPDNNFQPSFISTGATIGQPAGTNETISSTWKFSFVLSGTTTPIALAILSNIIDNDGVAGNPTIRESITSVTTPTSMAVSNAAGGTASLETIIGNQFLGPATNQAGIGSGTEYIGYYYHNNVSTFTYTFAHNIVIGATAVSGAVSTRYSSFVIGCEYPGTPDFSTGLVSISGTIFNDANGLVGDNTVNGTPVNSLGLIAYLYDNTTGYIIDSARVSPTGTYSFTGVTPGDSYTVHLSTLSVPLGNAVPPASVMPNGYTATGENLGAGIGNDGTINSTIPVGIVTTNTTNANFAIQRPPTAVNNTQAPQPNPQGTTNAPVNSNMFVGLDPDATIAGGGITSFTITSFPTNATSITINGIKYGPGFTPFPVGGVSITAVSGAMPANAIQVDPIDGVATVDIPYTVTDAANTTSAPATVKVPFINLPPTANNFTNVPMPQGNGPTTIPGLVASDPDGTIASYRIKTLPPTTEGVLSVPCGTVANPTPAGATCVGGFADLTAAVLAANSGGIALTPSQIAAMKFDPAPNFSGTAQFTFDATDNSGAVSNVATYRLPVIQQPPVSNNIMENSMPNTNGPTPIQGLSSSDADGTIASYSINTIPNAATQGVLSYCNGGTGATCAGGSFVNITGVTSLTAAQMATLRFDPVAGFVGNAVFNYNATDNSGNVSNTASYTIPVSATVTPVRPPLADNITAQPLNNSLGATPIPPLQATDLDGTVANYTISTIPPASQGILSLNGVPVIANQVLTPAQISMLQFDPAPTFTGNATFNYFATDNTGLVSNTAVYTIPVVNTPPVATNINATVPFASGPTAIPNLSGADADGTIASYAITTIPNATTQGVLSYFNGTAFVNITGPITLTPTQAATLRFDVVNTFSGTAPFTYTTTDNNGNVSAPATYTISTAPVPPKTTDIVTPVMPNTNGPTAVPVLAGTDADGTIASYTIFTVPPASQGVLSIGGVPVIAGQVLTPAQAATLQFDPAPGFTGNATFTYGATDNSGLTSNVSNYTIPVSGTGLIPPVANNISAPAQPSTNGPTAIPALVGSDADGTVTSFQLETIPPTSQGVLSVPCGTVANPTPAGQVCTGGFFTITPAFMTSLYPGGFTLTPTQAAGIRFDPDPNFTGNATFVYSSIDNNGLQSTGAVYSIPVTATPPIANPVIFSPISQASGPTPISPLVASDVEGPIASYQIETIPPASQGVLSIGGVPVTPGQTLTPAQISMLQFDPAPGYQGNVVFNYHATDGSGAISNTTTYTIPVSGLPPVSNNIVVSQNISNLSGPKTIPPLSSSDADGSIGSYTINSIPPASQGVLLVGGVPVTPGQVLTPAQILTLQFDPAPGFVGNAVFNYTAFDNNGNISNVATYTIPVDASALVPLSLISFNGAREGKNIIVKWNTENEINVDRFEIEYSTGAVNFKKGATVTAKNQTSNDYQNTLVNYSEPYYYIRLKSIDVNGRFKYSSIIVIKLVGGNTKAIAVTPNPVSENITLRITSDIAAKTAIRILNMNGQVIYQTTKQIAKGENIVYVNELQNLSNGTYLVQAVINGEMLVQKLVVNR